VRDVTLCPFDRPVALRSGAPGAWNFGESPSDRARTHMSISRSPHLSISVGVALRPGSGMQS
jgi:hypothetical protein